MSSSSTVGLRSGADTEPLDAELLRERLRARRDARPKLRRLDEHRIAAAREDLALEPLVIAVRAFGERRSVGQPSRAAFGREARDVLRVENLRRPRITELRRFEAVAGLEMPERFLELLANPRERRVRFGGDHRADVLESEANRARLERREPRRRAEG